MSAANYKLSLWSISEEQRSQICASFRMLHFSSCIKTSTTYFHLLALVTVLVAVLECLEN